MSKGLALARGAAIACMAGALGFGLVLLFDLAVTETGVVFLVGSMAGVVVGLSSSSDVHFETAGALSVLVFIVLVGVVTGFGWLELSVIGGSMLAVAWVLTGEWRPTDPWRWFHWGGVVIPVLVFVLLPLILDGGTLGHDESAYALKARQWLDGSPGTGWDLHRGTGMSVYGYLVLSLGGEEAGLRLLGLTGAIALAAGAWALGRRMADARVGAVAAVGVVAGPAVLLRSTEYLSDAPAAALLLFCMVILWREFNDRDAPSYHLLWFLPLAWGAFYLRYQSALSLALVALVAVWLWWPKIRNRPGPVVWLVVVGFLGLIPHFLQSIDLTGSVWGIVLNTSSSAVRAYVGEGLGDYAQLFGWQLGGYVAPIALVAALFGLIATWRNRGTRKGFTFLLVPALSQVVALGLISHGEPRFIFFPLALVVVAGAMSIVALLSERPIAGPHALALALSVIVVGSFALSASDARRWVSNRTNSNEPVELAAREVRGRVTQGSCGVMTSYAPQVTFYSGCATDLFRGGLEPKQAVVLVPGDSKFLVLIEGGKRQPSGERLEELVDLTVGPPTVLEGARRNATVYTFEFVPPS